MKELARQVFRHVMWLVLRLPGSRSIRHLIRRSAPGLVEWLKLRYVAYEQRARLPASLPVLTVRELTETLLPQQAAPADMSDDEARLYRQFVTNGIAGPAAR